MDKRAFYNITYGLYLLTAFDDNRDNGCIINTAIQVADNPARISISVIKSNLTCDYILRTGKFNISAITEEAPFGLFQRFGMNSGRKMDKFADFDKVARSENGLLYLTENSNMYMSGKVTDFYDLGSHVLFIAEVTEAVVLTDKNSCSYGFYQSNIKPKPKAASGTQWICSVCGYVYEGEEVPDDYICPLCKHGKDAFERSNKAPNEEYVWADRHILGIAKDTDKELLEGLRANFEGECCEVGMYLAMARVAVREGLPQIGNYWQDAAYEEAEHAAKFAELLGEVLTDSTRKNLELRLAAEHGATAGKVELAQKARAAGLDAIADTVFEMARDEARHGKGFEGLLKKYFTK